LTKRFFKPSSLEETLRIDDDLFDNINLDLGRFDKSRQFKIFENVYVGEKFVELSKTLDVTLASQASLDRLHWIIEVAKFWYHRDQSFIIIIHFYLAIIGGYFLNHPYQNFDF